MSIQRTKQAAQYKILKKLSTRGEMPALTKIQTEMRIKYLPKVPAHGAKPPNGTKFLLFVPLDQNFGQGGPAQPLQRQRKGVDNNKNGLPT
jgi:hypothetical protein